ncbi:MAG: hypothetical protein HOI67_03975 [Gammaproteobacteria bacterium]|nr:hypothetical protein [Gammaproteobacteria bacterium]
MTSVSEPSVAGIFYQNATTTLSALISAMSSAMSSHYTRRGAALNCTKTSIALLFGYGYSDTLFSRQSRHWPASLVNNLTGKQSDGKITAGSV